MSTSRSLRNTQQNFQQSTALLERGSRLTSDREVCAPFSWWVPSTNVLAFSLYSHLMLLVILLTTWLRLQGAPHPSRSRFPQMLP